MFGWAWLFWQTGAARKWGLLEIALGAVAYLIWAKEKKQWPFGKPVNSPQSSVISRRRMGLRWLRGNAGVEEKASDEGARRLALKYGRTMRKIVAMAALALSMASARSYAQFPAAPGTGPGLAETIEAIDSARVTTRILYVTAHPDDEKRAVLTYLARGLHADVALLSLTRGEGGQNALGPEQAPQLD